MQVRSWAIHIGLIDLVPNLRCLHEGCNRPTSHDLKGCNKHVGTMALNGMNANTKTGLGERQEQELVKAFESAARRQWTRSPNYDWHSIEQRMQAIKSGEQPGSSLVILDTEFSVTSRQLWEVSIIELELGDTILNTTIKYEGHRLLHRKKGVPGVEAFSKAHAGRVYSCDRKNIDHLDVHQVAARLQAIGINSDTMFGVWHMNACDLVLLRKFLEEAGYYGYVPSDENCIPLIPIYRHNLGKIGRHLFPMKLSIVFPLMFPYDELNGRNHEAEFDCKQTRLAWQGFEELCKPIEKRGQVWRPETVSRARQQSIKAYLTNPSKKRKRCDTEETDSSDMEETSKDTFGDI